MFRKMSTEPTPARVYALYKIVTSKKECSRNEAQKCMEPEGIYEGNSIFWIILNTAIELDIIDQQENNVLVPKVPKDEIKSIEDMRRHAIKQMNRFEGEQFFEFTNIVLNMDEQIYKNQNIAYSEFTDMMSSKMGIQISAPMARGWRFWVQFLGLGYMNQMAFLPNAYIYIKNVLQLMNLEKGKEYKIDEFMMQFNQYGKILTNNPKSNRTMNLAMSSGLRELHENGEIELKFGSDADVKWTLFPSSMLFNKQVASIVYKGVKK